MDQTWNISNECILPTLKTVKMKEMFKTNLILSLQASSLYVKDW